MKILASCCKIMNVLAIRVFILDQWTVLCKPPSPGECITVCYTILRLIIVLSCGPFQFLAPVAFIPSPFFKQRHLRQSVSCRVHCLEVIGILHRTRHVTVTRKWHFQTATQLTKGQQCHWDLYRDKAYFPNGTATSLPEEQAVMMCLWFMKKAVHSLAVLSILKLRTSPHFYQLKV